MLEDETQPLNPKAEAANSQAPALLILHLLEIVVLASSIFYLPYLSDECSHAPLKVWVSVLVGLTGAHLLVFGTHQLLGQLGKAGSALSLVVQIIHGSTIAGLLGWLGVGHYWVFFPGLRCNETPDFLTAVLLLVAFDALLLAIGGATTVSLCAKWCKKE